MRNDKLLEIVRAVQLGTESELSACERRVLAELQNISAGGTAQDYAVHAAFRDCHNLPLRITL